MKVKYITYKNAKHDAPDIIVFSSLLKHSDVAAKMGITDDVIGAGFIAGVAGQSLICYGESTSLDVEAHPDDEGVARVWLADLIPN